MLMRALKTLGTKSLPLAAALGALSACSGVSILEGGGSVAPEVKWGWERTMTFTTEAGTGKKVFIEWRDPESVTEISSNIKQHIGAILQEKHGLTVLDRSDEADYFVQVYLRYFNANGEADHGESIIQAAGAEIGGGRPEWVVPGEGPISEAIPVEPIPDLSDGSTKEWVLLIDVAVGEKGGDQTYPDKYALRRGRLLGYVSGRRLGREEALWLFKYGKLPPVPPEPVDGVVPSSYVAPDPTLPPETLLAKLIPELLPLVH